MKNLEKAIVKEIVKHSQYCKDNVTECKTVEELLSKWQITQFIPSSSKKRDWSGPRELKAYLYARIIKSEVKKTEEARKRLKTIEGAQDVQDITVTIEWKRSRTWGSNPTAEARVCYTDNTCDYFNSGSIGGCGYDKLSTAVADVLNQCNGLLKALYTEKNRPSRMNKNNRDVFGYGSGSGHSPRFEGGVGINCFDQIFNSIKFNAECISSGKTFDVYRYTKK